MQKMRYDAGKENWMPMEIRGVQGYFSDLRIDRASVPGWFHFWELADGDSDGPPCRYKPQILANSLMRQTSMTASNVNYTLSNSIRRILIKK